MPLQKTCSICLLHKNIDYFRKDGRTRDGFRAYCKDCEVASKYPDGLKKCSKCSRLKPLNDFRQNRRLPDGLRTDCRICESERKKQEYDRDVEIHRSRKRKFYHEHKQERNKYNRKYYSKNSPALKDYQRRYRERNIDKLKAQRKMRYSANPGIFKARANIRRVRLIHLSEHFTVEQWQALCQFYNQTCLCCGRREPTIVLSPDHVIPIARGGSNSIKNIQPLCLECNKKKYVKVIDYRKDFELFLAQLELEKE